jgi:hypothetical protein
MDSRGQGAIDGAEEGDFANCGPAWEIKAKQKKPAAPPSSAATVANFAKQNLIVPSGAASLPLSLVETNLATVHKCRETYLELGV